MRLLLILLVLALPVALAVWFWLGIRKVDREAKARRDEFLAGMPDEYVRIYKELERGDDGRA